jgi:hypothetical protein
MVVADFNLDITSALQTLTALVKFPGGHCHKVHIFTSPSELNIATPFFDVLYIDGIRKNIAQGRINKLKDQIINLGG